MLQFNYSNHIQEEFKKTKGLTRIEKITISSGLSMPNWTIRTLATSAGEKGNRISMAVMKF